MRCWHRALSLRGRGGSPSASEGHATELLCDAVGEEEGTGQTAEEKERTTAGRRGEEEEEEEEDASQSNVARLLSPEDDNESTLTMMTRRRVRPRESGGCSRVGRKTTQALTASWE